MGGIATVAGRGRKPKPTKLKELNGNAGKRALNKNEPQFDKIMNIEPPKWLEPLGISTMWKPFARRMHGGDRLKLRLTSMAWLCRTQRLGFYKKNPAVTVMNETARQLVSFGSLLGLDPASRTRLTGGGKAETVSNPFADLDNF